KSLSAGAGTTTFVPPGWQRHPLAAGGNTAWGEQMSSAPVGLVLGSHLAPEQIASTARLGEQLGFRELWLAEDYFFTGGISGAADLTEQGEYFSFNQVKLTYPPSEPVPVFMGIIGPKMLHLSGEIADGTVGSVMAGTRYLTWAREQIASGQAAAGRSSAPHPF